MNVMRRYWIPTKGRHFIPLDADFRHAAKVIALGVVCLLAVIGCVALAARLWP